jgi:quercetin dioxygenase-like cupin family protein
MMKTLIAAAAAILISTTAFAQGHSHADAHVALKDVKWVDAPIPGVQLALAWGEDAKGATWLFKMNPGVALPRHTHTNTYWGLTIAGNWVHIEANGKEIRTVPGDYSMVKGGVVHADRCDGPIACIGLLHFIGPRDVQVVK